MENNVRKVCPFMVICSLIWDLRPRGFVFTCKFPLDGSCLEESCKFWENDKCSLAFRKQDEIKE